MTARDSGGSFHKSNFLCRLSWIKMLTDKSDVLSGVFSTLRLETRLYFRANLAGAEAVRIPPERQRIRFHLVLQGTGWVSVGAESPVPLAEGDLVLIPGGAAQVLGAALPEVLTPLEDAIARGDLANGVLSVGEGAERILLLCGFAGFDEAVQHPAMADLPPVVHLRPNHLGAEPWMAATLRLLALEAGLDGAGSPAIVARLVEIALIQTIRSLAQGGAMGRNGFAAALMHPALAPALRAMHQEPERNWRVGDLAAAAGMSRSRFSARFTDLVGVPPLTYLTDWRLARARFLLRESGDSVAQVAARCGYASVPSFTRRFRQRFGVGPGAFRRSNGQ